MTISKLPTKAELQRLEEVKTGSGEQLIHLHFEAIRRDQERQDRELDAKLMNLRHIQRYRYFSVASGCLLALASLGVCAYSVHHNVDITPLAWILCPLAGLAGVFIWGYRPSPRHEPLPTPEIPDPGNVPRLPSN